MRMPISATGRFIRQSRASPREWPPVHAADCQSLLRRNLVEEAGDASQAAILDEADVGAFDDGRRAFRSEFPREADVVFETVRLTLEREAKRRESAAGRRRSAPRPVMAVALHDRIAVADVFGEGRLEQDLPAAASLSFQAAM